ncbi:TetR family transcriptional regulator [Nakamurella sp. YIM 132087]|uniref:TetR family transcriptional regulator n=1 Tax=Nakamurella alba TaxID=2665158 RepID=A0A7K1FJI5_9ACTN|nr:TetR/AcrR family transcriptional regulator [Nakamurella alba]MTD14258.1 TetR family transcriptional regulator [Nakamurella alba]
MPRPSCREQIVDAARTEFHRLGFHGCSVDTITKAAGVPKGSFYNHFPGKEQLAAEVVRRYQEASAWRTADVAGLGPLDELAVRFGALADRHSARSWRRGCLLFNLGAEAGEDSPVLRAAVRAALDDWTARAAALVDAAVRDGSLPAGTDPDRRARFLVTAYEGAVTRSKIEQSDDALDDFFDCALGVARPAPVAATTAPSGAQG